MINNAYIKKFYKNMESLGTGLFYVHIFEYLSVQNIYLQ